MLRQIAQQFKDLIGSQYEWSLRLLHDQTQGLHVRQGITEAPSNGIDVGYMLTLYHNGSMAYAASSDYTRNGMQRAIDTALAGCQSCAGHMLIDEAHLHPPQNTGTYTSQVTQTWSSVSLKDKFDLLQSSNELLRRDQRIVDSSCSLTSRLRDTLIISSSGADIAQQHEYITPALSTIAHDKGETQSRRYMADVCMRQGGFEQLDKLGINTAAEQINEEVLQLLYADDCPEGKMDLLLMPGQMFLQIHESIGHPLELDRILGDERNYAGTSFVTQEMFGTYQYGSELLNVSFDPSIGEQNASYGFDDDGNNAKKVLLIENGILKRPLGGALSQARTGIEGCANSRASSWNRPALDRMSNLNVEPGDSSLDEMISSVEHGILMDNNRAWSIDDSRNKFQFGCEYGRLIKNGELTDVVKNSNYRGISSSFWRSLKAVGNQDSFTVLGLQNCGKAEPNQIMFVGHASPPCLFADVAVFGAS